MVCIKVENKLKLIFVVLKLHVNYMLIIIE